MLQVNAEFTRITTKPLVSTFLFQLDHYTDPLLKAFRKKGGTAGLKITGIMAAMDKVGSCMKSFISVPNFYKMASIDFMCKFSEK